MAATEKKPRAFTVAAKDYFGLKPGQTAKEFLEELKQLTYEEKCEIATAIRATGAECTDPVNTTESK